MSDTNDEQLLNGDDDMDYDLDENEEALLLDDDDKSDEVEEDISEADISLNESSDAISRREGKFSSERKTITASITSTSNNIPDTLDKVNINNKNLQGNKSSGNKKQTYHGRNKSTFNKQQNQRQRSRNDNSHKYQKIFHTKQRFGSAGLSRKHHQIQPFITNTSPIQPWATNIHSQTEHTINNIFMPLMNRQVTTFSNHPTLMLETQKQLIPQTRFVRENALLTYKELITSENNLEQKHNQMILQNCVNQLGTLPACLSQKFSVVQNQSGQIHNTFSPSAHIGTQQNALSQYTPQDCMTKGFQQNFNVYTQSIRKQQSYQQKAVMDLQQIPEEDNEKVEEYRQKIREQKKKHDFFSNRNEKRRRARVQGNSEAQSCYANNNRDFTIISNDFSENQKTCRSKSFLKNDKHSKNMDLMNPSSNEVISVPDIRIVVPNEVQSYPSKISKNLSNTSLNAECRKVSIEHNKDLTISNLIVTTRNIPASDSLLETRRVLMKNTTGIPELKVFR